MNASGVIRTMAAGARALLWCVGRKLYCRARGDYPNRPETNGEYWLLDQVLGGTSREVVAIDVGANEGDWALRAIDLASRHRVTIRLYAFEPAAQTRAVLTRRLSEHQTVSIYDHALSSGVGDASFYSSENGSGTSSLSEISGSSRELVKVTTLDSFLAEERIEHIDILKIDTEGFDFEVLRGGEQFLAKGVIEVVQFEYNWRWLINHHALRDVFEYIKDKPYRLGKLV